MQAARCNDKKLIARIAESFEYRDGKIFWKSISKYHLEKLGKEAGNPAISRGKAYWYTKIDGKTIKRHQIVFSLFNGYIPALIDHINRDSTDDRIENLRAADVALNNHNHSRKNVRALNGKFQARLGQINLGMFNTYNEAVSAYDTARRELWKT